MFKTREGGGCQGPFKQCLKKLHNWRGMASLRMMVDSQLLVVDQCVIKRLSSDTIAKVFPVRSPV